MDSQFKIAQFRQRFEIDALNELPNFAANNLPRFPFHHFEQALCQRPVGFGRTIWAAIGLVLLQVPRSRWPLQLTGRMSNASLSERINIAGLPIARLDKPVSTLAAIRDQARQAANP